METALSKFTNPHHQSPLSFHHHRPSISPLISSLAFRFPPKSSSIKASSSSNFYKFHIPIPKNPKPQIVQTLNPYPFSLLRTTLIAAVTATTLFFARFNLKPVIAVAVSPPSTVEESVSNEESERNLEEYLNSHPNDLQTLKTLLEVKIKQKKVQEAIQIIDQLIELEPEDTEWPLVKSHMYYYCGDTESAKNGFNQILSKDPLRVEAYHGLVLAASDGDSDTEMKEIEKRIREGTELVKKENKRKELRNFMLLLAQLRVFDGDFNEALKVYEELVKEEPRDFRPYLCQGIIYTLLKKKDEAEKNFQKYRRLIPKGHPYAEYLDNSLTATKLFAQEVENDRARAKS